jgi:hypothetical protein
MFQSYENKHIELNSTILRVLTAFPCRPPVQKKKRTSEALARLVSLFRIARTSSPRVHSYMSLYLVYILAFHVAPLTWSTIRILSE